MILDKQHQAREFLTPLPEEDRLGEELLGHLKGQGRPTNTADPVTSERGDTLPPHLFEALIACLLEDQGHRTILTARSNDHGADVLSFREGEVWIVQVKHTAKEILVGSVAIPLLGIWKGGGMIGSIIVAFVGAVTLVLISRMLKGA